MFTGIVQGVGVITGIHSHPGLVTLSLELPDGLHDSVQRGASIAVDGVCLTVTDHQERTVSFDLMGETLQRTTLEALAVGSMVNIERAAKHGAEVGGHVLSGHVDTVASITSIERPQNNYVVRFKVSSPWQRYIFTKGYIAINGASLTVADVDKLSGTFAVWLIPETLRLTTFGQKEVGGRVNIEIDRTTQVIVDTVRDYLDELVGGKQGAGQPLDLEALAKIKS